MKIPTPKNKANGRITALGCTDIGNARYTTHGAMKHIGIQRFA